MRQAILALFVAAFAAGAKYPGKYRGEFTSSGGGRQPVTATIREEGGGVTGTMGPSPEQQAALLNGKLTGGTLTFEFQPLGGLRISFPAAGEVLQGTVERTNGQPPIYDRLTLRRTGPLTLADTMPPLPQEGPIRAERMLRLREQLARGPEAVVSFWASVKESGAPLVEDDPADKRFQLVTFLWRGKPEDKNILVLWPPFSTARQADFLMIQIPGTDIWFRTLRLPRGSRLKYTLSPNDPLNSTERRMGATDPLNPNGVNLELPGAPAQPFYQQREGVPKLARQEHKLRSTFLNQERTLLVYTPPGYDGAGGPYASLYLFDGEDKEGHVFASWTLENLIAEKKIPPMVVVRIVNPAPGARQQLAANPRFFEFLSKEAVPFVRANYRVDTDAGRTVISGYSLGGFAAAYAGLRHPELFGAVLSQSGSFWFDPTSRDELTEPGWMARQFIDSPKRPVRFYLDAGQFELDMTGKGGNILLPNRHLRDVLRAKGYDVTYREFAGGHDGMNWRGTLADGLMALFPQ